MWSLLDFTQQEEVERCQDAVTEIALSKDETWLAIGSRDGSIHLWQWGLTTDRQVATLHHDWTVSALSFTPDRPTLISASADETMRWWHATGVDQVN